MHTVPQKMDSLCVRMSNVRRGQLVAFQQLVELIERQISSVFWAFTPIEPLAPPCLNAFLKSIQASDVAGYTVKIVVSPQLYTKSCMLLPQRLMAIFLAPLDDPLYRCPKLLAGCFSFDHPHSSSRLAPVVGEPQKIEAPRFALPPEWRHIDRLIDSR